VLFAHIALYVDKMEGTAASAAGTTGTSEESRGGCIDLRASMPDRFYLIIKGRMDIL
jgi:hypothetical protein